MKARPIGWVAVAFAIAALATLLGILVANGRDEPAAIVVPSAIAFLAPMVAGSAIALVGIARGSRPLLLIAGTTLGLMSVAAFSGVTLILLVPSVLLFYAAANSGPRIRPEPTSIRRWLIVIAAAMVTAPVVVLLMTRLGVVGFVGGFLVVLLVGSVPERATGHQASRPSARSIVVSVGVVGFLLTGTIALFGQWSSAAGSGNKPRRVLSSPSVPGRPPARWC
jgi:hypothetical protein